MLGFLIFLPLNSRRYALLINLSMQVSAMENGTKASVIRCLIRKVLCAKVEALMPRQVSVNEEGLLLRMNKENT